MDDGDSGFGIGPDVIHLRERADLCLELTRDELFHVRGLHTGEERTHHHLTNGDGRVFLAGKGEELI